LNARRLEIASAAAFAVLASHGFAAEGPSAISLCGYAPHNHVVLIDRAWHLWLPYPATDPLRPIEFGSGLRSYRAENHTCARVYVAAGSGTITWGRVRIEIGESAISVNGRAVEFGTNLSIDADGKVSPNAYIRTFE
jgi:hypothetical protein